VVVPRQIAMYLAKQMTEASLPEIGRQFGNKHHTTVMHSIAKNRRAAPHRQGSAPHAEQAAGAVERVAQQVSELASLRVSEKQKAHISVGGVGFCFSFRT